MKTIFGINQWKVSKAAKRIIGSAVIYQDFYTNKEKVVNKITGMMNEFVGVGNWGWIQENQTFTMANYKKTGKPFRYIFTIVTKDLYED